MALKIFCSYYALIFILSKFSLLSAHFISSVKVFKITDTDSSAPKTLGLSLNNNDLKKKSYRTKLTV